jgi:hypothetical protein
MSLDNDDYNIFSNILYSKHINEGVLLTLTAFVGFVIIPGAIEQQSQCKYFASSSSENDTIPCNQYLVGLIFPWLIAAILNHF